MCKKSDTRFVTVVHEVDRQLFTVYLRHAAWRSDTTGYTGKEYPVHTICAMCARSWPVIDDNLLNMSWRWLPIRPAPTCTNKRYYGNQTGTGAVRNKDVRNQCLILRMNGVLYQFNNSNG
jgi:hypothetical protein